MACIDPNSNSFKEAMDRIMTNIRYYDEFNGVTRMFERINLNILHTRNRLIQNRINALNKLIENKKIRFLERPIR